MEEKEIKMLLLQRRMEAKLEIEKFRYLSQNSKLNFDNKINELLDLIATIDKALEKLK
jgi:hypothetical protein